MMFSVLESATLLLTTIILFGGVAYWMSRVAHADTAISKAQFLVAIARLGTPKRPFQSQPHGSGPLRSLFRHNKHTNTAGLGYFGLQSRTLRAC